MVAVPYYIMGPMILLFSFIGAFSVRNNFFDIWTAVFFGILGYLMDKVKIPTTPLVLSLILMPMLESSLRQSMGMAAGSLTILFTRPLALAFLIAGVMMTLFSLYARFRKPKMKVY
jgi:putative tricarboxylic transport membrane protein